MANNTLDDFTIVSSVEDHEKQQKLLENAQNENKLLTEKNNELSSSLQHIEQEKKELQQKIAEKVVELDDNKSRNILLQIKLDDLTTSNETLTNERNKLKEQLDFLQENLPKKKNPYTESVIMITLHRSCNDRWYVCEDTFTGRCDEEKEAIVKKLNKSRHLKFKHCGDCYGIDNVDITRFCDRNQQNCFGKIDCNYQVYHYLLM